MKEKKSVIFFRYALLTIGVILSCLPMIYMISTSLRPNGALYEYPPRFFPKLQDVTVENYQYIISQNKFYINFFNSVIVSVSTVALAAIISSGLAFVIARFQFPGRKVLRGQGE